MDSDKKLFKYTLLFWYKTINSAGQRKKNQYNKGL